MEKAKRAGFKVEAHSLGDLEKAHPSKGGSAGSVQDYLCHQLADGFECVAVVDRGNEVLWVFKAT